MKILVYAPTVGRGGVHRVIETLTDALAQVAPTDAYQFDVLGQTYDEIGLPVSWPEGWGFTQIDPGPVIPAHPHQFQWLHSHRQDFFNHLTRVAAGYDLIFCPSPWWTMRIDTWKLPVPFVTVVADFAFDHIDMGLLAYNFRYIAKLIAERADYVVFLSNWQRQWGIEHYGYRPKTTQVIYHSGDFTARTFEPTGDEALRVRTAYDLPPFYMLSFHPMYHKGILTLLKAYALARQQRPEMREPLVVAGIGTEHIFSTVPVDSHIDQVRALIQELGITQAEPEGKNDEDSILLYALGQMPEADIAGLYVGAAMSIVPSTSDGTLSGTIFESMMASTPLIVSDLPVFTEQLTNDNRYVLWFEKDNPEQLAQQMIALRQNRESVAAAKERAMNAYGFVTRRTRFDVAREYLGVFDRVVKARNL